MNALKKLVAARVPGLVVVSWSALLVSIAALAMSTIGPAGARSGSTGLGIGVGGGGGGSTHHHGGGSGAGRRGAVVRLGANGKIPAGLLPTVAKARDAARLDGVKAKALAPSCPPTSVDLGTWCLMSSPYPLTNADIGVNDYFWATQACVKLGGYLPTAAQLIGAANRVKLDSTINDSPLTSTIDQDPSQGLKDRREMSATLVTVTAGSDAAGSEGVTPGSTGDPNTGEPNPVPEPANPQPETLQYVTVYSNHQAGGFAGSEPVSQPADFRCAFNKVPGAANKSNK